MCHLKNFQIGVDPLSKIIEEETNSVWNSWAVILPVTVKSPSMDESPTLTPSSLNVCIELFVTSKNPKDAVPLPVMSPCALTVNLGL